MTKFFQNYDLVFYLISSGFVNEQDVLNLYKVNKTCRYVKLSEWAIRKRAVILIQKWWRLHKYASFERVNRLINALGIESVTNIEYGWKGGVRENLIMVGGEFPRRIVSQRSWKIYETGVYFFTPCRRRRIAFRYWKRIQEFVKKNVQYQKNGDCKSSPNLKISCQFVTEFLKSRQDEFQKWYDSVS